MPPSEERKLVTVLFGDLVGSTELARQRDPEQFRRLLSAFFALIERACSLFEEMDATGWVEETHAAVTPGT